LKRNAFSVTVEKRKGGNVEILGADGRITLKFILQQQDEMS